jgi:beta propeller repeat protein
MPLEAESPQHSDGGPSQSRWSKRRRLSPAAAVVIVAVVALSAAAIVYFSGLFTNDTSQRVTGQDRGHEFLIAHGADSDADPLVSGSIVVWGSDGKVRGKDLASGEAVDTGLAGVPVDFSGDVLASTTRQGFAVDLRNLKTGQRSDVVAPARITGVAVTEDYLIWRVAGEIDAHVRDLTGGDTTLGQGSPLDADGDDLVLATAVEEKDRTDLILAHLPQGATSIVSSAPGGQFEASISGDTVVWTDSRKGLQNTDIYGADVETGTEFVVCDAPGNQSHPRISGDIVVWEDERAGQHLGDVYARDLGAGAEFPIAKASQAQTAPSISGDIVVWLDWRDGGSEPDVYGLWLKR